MNYIHYGVSVNNAVVYTHLRAESDDENFDRNLITNYKSQTFDRQRGEKNKRKKKAEHFRAGSDDLPAHWLGHDK